jgi:hypothetical protein
MQIYNIFPAYFMLTIANKFFTRTAHMCVCKSGINYNFKTVSAYSRYFLFFEKGGLIHKWYECDAWDMSMSNSFWWWWITSFKHNYYFAICHTLLLTLDCMLYNNIMIILNQLIRIVIHVCVCLVSKNSQKRDKIILSYPDNLFLC